MKLSLRRIMVAGALLLVGWLSSWWYYHPINQAQMANEGELRNSDKLPISKISSIPRSNVKPDNLNNPSTLTRSTIQQGEWLLENHHYTKFIQTYIEFRAIANELQIAPWQTLVFDTVRNLKQRKSNQQALKLLSMFLEYEYDSSPALLLFAEIQHSQKNYLASMDALFRARSYTHKNDAIDAINIKIRALIAEQRSRLNKQDDNLPLLDFYKRLTELEPEYGPNFIGLAEVYISLGNLDDARNALSMVAHTPSLSDRLDRVYAKLDQTPALELAGATPVTLVRVNDQFLIDVMINSRQTARLLLDTGASISIISPSILSALGLSAQSATKMGWFNTANGVVSAPIFQIQSLSVDEYVVESIDVGVLNISSLGEIDGLLGMNFLKHFKFYIDQQNNVLFLR